MSSHDNLTILLTLKDRVPFTLRWMSYADQARFPFNVLIADGGTQEDARALLADKNKFPNVNYEYVRFPPDRSYFDYYTKIAQALGQIRTPYVAMADNDDFFFPATLVESVRFLSAHPDYVSCGGQGAVFWVLPSAPEADADLLYGKNIHWKCTRDTDSNENERAKERVLAQTNNTAGTFFYDVKRIEDARKQFGLVRDLNPRDLFLMEHLIRFLTATAGKSKRLNRLHIARQHNAPQTSAGGHTEKYGDWFGRMLVETWSNDFSNFLKAVSDSLAQADGIPIEEAKRCVVQAYRILVTPPLLSNLLDERSATIPMWTIVPVIRHLVRFREASLVRRIARSFFRRVPWISLEALYGTELIAKQVPNAEKDLSSILEFLKSGQ